MYSPFIDIKVNTHENVHAYIIALYNIHILEIIDVNAVLTLHAAFIHKIRHRNLSAIYLLIL
jgi:hypothetical protein